MPKQSLLKCNACGSPNVDVRGKYGAMLHTVCHGCGLDNWSQVQHYLRSQRLRVRGQQVDQKRVEVHRNGKVEIHTLLKRT